MTNKFLFLVLIICFAILSGCTQKQPITMAEAEKQVDILSRQIINLGYTSYTAKRPINWKPLIENFSTYQQVMANPQKMVSFTQDLYETLKQFPLDYPYCLYIGEEFGAGHTRHNHNLFYLQVKYGASQKELIRFFSYYQHIYNYQKLEKSLLGGINKEERNLNGLPLFINPVIYISHLNQYYDWLSAYSRRKPNPTFKDLKQINQQLGYQAVALFMIPRLSTDPTPYPYIKIKNYQKGRKTVDILFTMETPLDKLNSLAPKIKKMF